MSEELKPVAWRYFDGGGNYEYREDEPSESSVYHAAIYGRKFEPLYLSAVDGGKSEAVESAIPAGWKFNTADFSVSPGSVMLKRDKAGTDWWMALSDEGREETALYVFGRGVTIEEAISAAAIAAKKEKAK